MRSDASKVQFEEGDTLKLSKIIRKLNFYGSVMICELVRFLVNITN